MNYIDNLVEKYANKYFRKQSLVYGAVFLFLMLYSAHIAPKLPASVVQVFDNSFFKLFVFVLILQVAQVSPSMSILIAVAFLMTTNVMNNKKFYEFLDDIEYEEGMDEDIEYEYEEGMDEDIEYEYEEMDEDVEYEEGMDEDVEYEEEMDNQENLTNTISAVNALDALVQQAIVPASGDAKSVSQAMQTVIKNIDTSNLEAVKSIAALGEKALSTTPTNVKDIKTSAGVTISAIQEKVPSSITSGIQALNILSTATSAPQTLSPNIIKTAAQTVIKTIPETPLKQQAIKDVLNMAQVATTAAPVSKDAIVKKTQDIVDVLLTDTSGCIPKRQSYDLSKVETYINKSQMDVYASFMKLA
jgi:hypothetical protein